MKKMKIVLALIMSIFLVGCGTNQQPEKVNVKWPLYEITKDGQAVGYILGSIHLGKKEWYPFPDYVAEKIDAADTIISEVAFNSLFSDAAFTSEKFAEISGSKFVSDYLSKEQQAILDQKLATYNLKFDYTKTTLIEIVIAMQQKDITQENILNGVDKKVYFYLERRDTLGKNIGFETIEEQMIFLKRALEDKILTNPDNWLQYLMDKEQSNKELENAFAAYENGQMDVIYTQSRNVNFDIGIVGDERNLNWIPILKEQFTKNNLTFVVVGAAHLLGEQGIIKLLEQEGYQFTLVTE